MKLYKFLLENKEDKYLKDIILECSDFFNFLKKSRFLEMGLWFYRGKNKKIEIFEKFIPRTNRKPLNLSKEKHKILNDYFLNRFGWKVRSEGVFATSDFNFSSQFGIPYIFIPSNNYKFVYHPNIDDIYQLFIDKNEKKILNDLIGYTDNQLSLAMINKVEVAFKCKYYYLINIKYSNRLIELLQ